jgi:hypothetical protein
MIVVLPPPVKPSLTFHQVYFSLAQSIFPMCFSRASVTHPRITAEIGRREEHKRRSYGTRALPGGKICIISGRRRVDPRTVSF